MIVQYCSDLHLEFPINKKYVKEHPLNTVGEILLLAGDIVPFGKIPDCNDFFDFVSANFRQVFWVPGNHEYYKGDIKDKGDVIQESIRKNVFLLNNCTVTVDNILAKHIAVINADGSEHKSCKTNCNSAAHGGFPAHKKRRSLVILYRLQSTASNFKIFSCVRGSGKPKFKTRNCVASHPDIFELPGEI